MLSLIRSQRTCLYSSSCVRNSQLSWLLVLLITILLFVPGASFAQARRTSNAPERIRFTVGAISAQVHGRFTPTNERVRYVIKANKGDHMVLNIIPVTRGLTMAGTVGHCT